jgi:predicted RNA methylase
MNIVSYKDPEAKIIGESKNNKILRLVDKKYYQSYKVFLDSDIYNSVKNDGLLVDTCIDESSNIINNKNFLLEHKKIENLNYPDEWSYSMLKDAAISHIDLNLKTLSKNLITIDGHSSNLTFNQGKFIFLDFGSLKEFDEQPWQGFDQFAESFIYPLILGQKNSELFELYNNSKECKIKLNQIYNTFSFCDFFSFLKLKYVYLQVFLNFLASKFKNKNNKTYKISKDRINILFELIKKDIESLKPSRKKLSWKDYNKNIHYSGQDLEIKKVFLKKILSQQKECINLCIDFGSNTGVFSRIAAEFAKKVVSVEADEEALDALYLNLVKKEKINNIIPLLLNIEHIQFSNGFKINQRSRFLDRFNPNLVICYALMHHLIFTNNISLEEMFEFLTNLKCPIIIEYVPEEDKMSILLKKNKKTFHRYNKEIFEKTIKQFNYKIVETKNLKDNSRIIYFLKPKH